MCMYSFREFSGIETPIQFLLIRVIRGQISSMALLYVYVSQVPTNPGPPAAVAPPLRPSRSLLIQKE